MIEAAAVDPLGAAHAAVSSPSTVMYGLKEAIVASGLEYSDILLIIGGLGGLWFISGMGWDGMGWDGMRLHEQHW
jgi:hypothetical protein